MPNPDKPWGTCFHCDKDIQLKKDGTLRQHEDKAYIPDTLYFYRFICDGSGKAPGFLPKKFQKEGLA